MVGKEAEAKGYYNQECRGQIVESGLHEVIISKSAYNGHGAWWNSGASHMNLAFKKNAGKFILCCIGRDTMMQI